MPSSCEAQSFDRVLCPCRRGGKMIISPGDGGNRVARKNPGVPTGRPFSLSPQSRSRTRDGFRRASSSSPRDKPFVVLKFNVRTYRVRANRRRNPKIRASRNGGGGHGLFVSKKRFCLQTILVSIFYEHDGILRYRSLPFLTHSRRHADTHTRSHRSEHKMCT